MMKHSDSIWNEFIYGGHWLSIGGSAIVLSVMFLLDMQIKLEFLLIAYLGTQCIYNYNHHGEIDIDSVNNSNRTNHLERYREHFSLMTVLYGVGYFSLLAYFGNKQSLFFGGFLLLIGLFFTYKGKNISKKIVGFKSVYTASSWGLLVVFTAIYCSYSLNTSVLVLFVFVFLRWVVNTGFCDLKDIDSDKKEGLLTLPIVLNNNGLNFIHVINIISFLPIIIGVYIKALPDYALFSLILFFYSFYYIQKAKSEKTDILSLSYILADGEYYYWPFLLFMGFIFTSLL